MVLPKILLLILLLLLLLLLLLVAERTFEDHENLVEPLLAWTRDSENKILFQERPERNEVFKNPQVSGPSNLGNKQIFVVLVWRGSTPMLFAFEIRVCEKNFHNCPLQNFYLWKKDKKALKEIKNKDKELLIQVEWAAKSHFERTTLFFLNSISFFFLPFFLFAGELLWDLHHCAWPGGSAAPQGRRQEVMETATLPAEGIWNLLRAQGEEQGQGSKHTQIHLMHLPSQNIPLMSQFIDTNLNSSPVFPRPRLLCPVWQPQRLLRERLQDQIQGTHWFLLCPEGEFVLDLFTEPLINTYIPPNGKSNALTTRQLHFLFLFHSFVQPVWQLTGWPDCNK